MQAEQGTAQPFPGRSCTHAGICTTEPLQDVPLDSPMRPGYNDSSADAAAPAADAPSPALGAPQPPAFTGTGKSSRFTRPAVSAGGCPNDESCAARAWPSHRAPSAAEGECSRCHPATPEPPISKRALSAELWGGCAGGPPSWGNATGLAPPPWPAVNGTMTPKAPYNSSGRSPPHTCADSCSQPSCCFASLWA